MKKQIITILLTVLALSGITAGIAYASDVSGAIYFGKIRATNNSTATGNVSGVVTINGTAWIANGLMQSDASDIVVVDSGGSDTAFMPGTSGADWVIWMDDVPAGSQDLTIYTGASGGKMRTFFDTSGMTVVDDATLEPSDNFSISVAGWFDATTAGNITSKLEALQLFGDGSGNVIFHIHTGTWGIADNVTDPSTVWANESNASDNNTATYSNSNAVTSGSWTGYLVFAQATMDVHHVRYFYDDNNGVDEVDQVDIDVYTGGTWQDFFQGLPGAEGAYVTQQASDGFPVRDVTQWRIRWRGGGPGTSIVWLYETSTDQGIDISASGVASGEHTIAAASNGARIELYIDGTLQDWAFLP